MSFLTNSWQEPHQAKKDDKCKGSALCVGEVILVEHVTECSHAIQRSSNLEVANQPLDTHFAPPQVLFFTAVQHSFCTDKHRQYCSWTVTYFIKHLVRVRLALSMTTAAADVSPTRKQMQKDVFRVFSLQATINPLHTCVNAIGIHVSSGSLQSDLRFTFYR